MDLGFETQKRAENQHPRDSMCANFQAKQTALAFSGQICQKKIGFKIQKTNIGIRISILEILCMPSFKQNKQL